MDAMVAAVLAGGRVTGAEVIAELIQELHASAEVAQQFEGEMQKLASHARCTFLSWDFAHSWGTCVQWTWHEGRACLPCSALAVALECIRGAAGQQPIELLRKESLAGLAPAAAARVLSHAYSAVVPVAPLPAPPLPLTPARPGKLRRHRIRQETINISLASSTCDGRPAGPTNFGATAEAATPWLQLALYQAAASGPVGLVLPCGQRFWRLPACLDACSHALLWPWDAAAVRAQVLQFS